MERARVFLDGKSVCYAHGLKEGLMVKHLNKSVWLVWFVVVLCCVPAGGCRSRVCTSHFVCQGYGCRDLICLTECTKNEECDQTPRAGANNTQIPSGYVCSAGACVCDKAQPDAFCHRECFQAADCNKIIDPKTGEVMATKKGFVCQDPSKGDLPSDSIPGQCLCPTGTTCK